ncbi:MAG: hypothetical protein OXE17_04260 [Chloroflexi bacterium]|nr:hypothetical protein [Chloroflexota bacterium]
MEIPPMPPTPPDQRYWQAESDYRREQAQRGGLLSDVVVSLVLLARLIFLVVSFLPRLTLRAWRRHSQKNATR